MKQGPNDCKLMLHLVDDEWQLDFIDHDRQIVRAIVFDDVGDFYFVRVDRDDDFGIATTIETAGGGVEAGEDLECAIRRELAEELGADVEVLCELGEVSDYYNLIHRHNLNHYYLCKIKSMGERHLTQAEQEDFHLSTVKMSFDEALREYEYRTSTPLGRLLANRELPILHHAKRVMEEFKIV